MTTTPPNFGDMPWPERDPPYDHERAAKEFLDAADRIYSQAKVGAIPFDISMITAAQVNATIGVGEAILAMLQELRSRSKEKKGARSKERKKGSASNQDQDLEEVKGETYDRSPWPLAIGEPRSSQVRGELVRRLCRVGRVRSGRELVTRARAWALTQGLEALVY